jgi:hypothetical protein
MVFEIKYSDAADCTRHVFILLILCKKCAENKGTR